jgi:GTP-binding protein YchF
VNPVEDIEVINLELIFADMETVDKRIQRIEKLAKSKDKEAMAELPVLQQIKEALLQELPARIVELSPEEKKIVYGLHLLTMKPILYVANVSEDDLLEGTNEHVESVREYAARENAEVIVICARVEEEIAELDGEEKKAFLAELGIEEAGLDKLIRASYSLLGLATYFTAGVQEVRAWTFRKGMKAPQCAGIIHTDFERGFIRAEVVAYDDLVDAGTMAVAKERGKVRLEGKEYEMKDGDVVHFRFNV